MTPPLALIVLFGFGAVCAVAGALWAAARRDEALRDATVARQQLFELAEHWVWETDTAHVLRLWRPPTGQAPAWRREAPLGEPMWRLAATAARMAAPAAAPHAQARMTSESVDSLRRQMEAHAPLEDQRVTLALDDAGERGAPAGAWILRGVPRFDRRGRFQGYVGRARPVSATEAAAFAEAAFARLWWQAGGALFLFRRTATDLPWTLGRASDEARRLLGVDPAADAPPALEWAAACGALPAPVAAAIAQLDAGEACTQEGWQVSWTRIPAAGDEEAGRLLSVRRLPVTAAAPVPASADIPHSVSTTSQAAMAAASTEAPESAADHESFIYSVSHDLRAPIRVVEGFARILKEDYGRALDRIGNDHVERILAAAARMNHMIDALLALSRLQSQPLKRQPVDLSQLAAWIVEDLRSETPDRTVAVAIEPGLVVQGDPTLLRNAMENLVGNAWKYSARNPDARIVFRREMREGQPVNVVEDNGAGFDMRFADRLFGVFQRLHSAKDFAGTGVGLASVRRILRRHGGDIWAESEVGKGARFYFTLP
jgi:signal transduction histidine kinase